MPSIINFYNTWIASYVRARFGRTERGASLVEYVLLVALIAVACIVAITAPRWQRVWQVRRGRLEHRSRVSPARNSPSPQGQRRIPPSREGFLASTDLASSTRGCRSRSVPGGGRGRSGRRRCRRVEDEALRAVAVDVGGEGDEVPVVLGGRAGTRGERRLAAEHAVAERVALLGAGRHVVLHDPVEEEPAGRRRSCCTCSGTAGRRARR